MPKIKKKKKAKKTGSVEVNVTGNGFILMVCDEPEGSEDSYDEPSLGCHFDCEDPLTIAKNLRRAADFLEKYASSHIHMDNL